MKMCYHYVRTVLTVCLLIQRKPLLVYPVCAAGNHCGRRSDAAGLPGVLHYVVGVCPPHG